MLHQQHMMEVCCSSDQLQTITHVQVLLSTNHLTILSMDRLS